MALFKVKCAGWLALMLTLQLNPVAAIEKVAPATEKGVFTIFSLEPDRPSILMGQRVLSQAYAQLGIPVRFVMVPLLRSLVMWNNGSLDAVSFKLLDEGLSQAIKIPVAINYEEIVVFANNPEIKAQTYAGLQNYTVGYLGGVQILEDRLRDLPKTDVARSLDSLFKKLDAGRTDIVIDSRYSLCVAKRLGLQKVFLVEPGLEKRLGYHFIHQRHAGLAKSIERVLQQMEVEGTIKRIHEEVMHEYQQNCQAQAFKNQP